MSEIMSPQDYLAIPAAPADARVAYGPDPVQFGDLYLPSGSQGPCPLIILIHGGCWRAQFDLEPLGQLARAISRLGAAVWSIEFRRLEGGGGWPTTFLDVGEAADHARELAKDYPLDLERVIGVGHSAGGHLALWLAGRRHIDPGSEIYHPHPLALRAVVSLAGIPNLETAHEEGTCRGAPEMLMGGPPEAFSDRYRAGSPHHMLPLSVTHWHVTGQSDTLVSPDSVASFVNLAKTAGEDARLVSIPGAGHFEIVSPAALAWATVEPVIREALVFD